MIKTFTRCLAQSGAALAIGTAWGTLAAAADFQGSIGESMGAPVDYSVAVETAPDHEPAHAMRVADPYAALVPTLTPEVPLHVRPHSRDVLDDIEDRPFFDYNGWQTFIGLIWPAEAVKGGHRRGVADRSVSADRFKTINTTGDGSTWPVVFETLMSSEALFPVVAHPLDRPPPPPDWFATDYQRPFALTATQKAGALDEAASSPLVDQNRQYVRFGVQVNRVFYDFIRTNGYNWKGNLPKSPSPVQIPPLPVPGVPTAAEMAMGQTAVDDPLTLVLQPQTNTTVTQRVHGNSITIKTAWRIMIEAADPSKPYLRVDDLSRYYTTTATVQNAMTGARETKTVGLVGMHVVVRTTQFPQGLWSTFGHVDNLPPSGSQTLPGGGRASFSSDGRQFFPHGFDYQPSATDFVPEADRRPVEVSRIWKIPDTPVATPSNLPHGASTVGMNRSYQQLLAPTVWQYYQLEVTNWPTDPGSFYAKPFLQMRGLDSAPSADQPRALHEIYARNRTAADNAFPRWSGLPIPQVGALNPVLETYFQNPPKAQPLESTSCIGCHYGASDLGYVWVFKLGTQPQPYAQGRVDPTDSVLASEPAVRSLEYRN